MTHYTLESLEKILSRCKADNFSFSMFIMTSEDKPCHVSLEKGSSYGAMHMKFSAQGATVAEAFEACIRNFPSNPVGALWDSARLSPPPEVEDAVFTEIKTPPSDDEIQF